MDVTLDGLSKREKEKLVSAGRKGFLARFIIFLILCLGIGAFGGWATQSSIASWYNHLSKPPLNPPSGIFAPVWTMLYILMAACGGRIWSAQLPSSTKLKMLFISQLALNAAWSWFFFGLRNPLAGLLDIALLWVCLSGLLGTLIRSDKISVLLILPYWAWVSFAFYLNAGLWWLNRP